MKEPIEIYRTTWSKFNVSLADGQNWSQPYTFRINDTGLRNVQFLLFKDGDSRARTGSSTSSPWSPGGGRRRGDTQNAPEGGAGVKEKR